MPGCARLINSVAVSKTACGGERMSRQRSDTLVVRREAVHEEHGQVCLRAEEVDGEEHRKALRSQDAVHAREVYFIVNAGKHRAT